MVVAFNMEKSVEDWSIDPICQVSLAELQQRLAKGWRPERAITEPAELPVGKPRDRKRRKHSRFWGVSWHEGKQKWQAHIRHEGKLIHLGRFDSEEDAALAFNVRSRELRGTDGRINKV